jgi:putative ABC transport system permease protein
LYLSSVATAAVHNELAHTCLADVGVQIWMDGSKPDSEVRLAVSAPLAAHTQPGVLTRIDYFVGIKTDVPGVAPVRAYLMYRDGQEQNLLRTVKPPGAGEVLAPEWLFPPNGTRPGDVLALSSTSGQGVVTWSQTVAVIDTYPLVPTRPEAAYWCGLRSFFRSPTSDPADAPTPVLFGTSDEVRTSGLQRIAIWELRPDPRGLSRHDALVLAGRFDEFAAKVTGSPVVDARGRVLHAVTGGDPLRLVVRHAETAAAVVAGTMAPVRLVGLLASLTLLIAATTLLAREQQRELRLRLLKGQSPASLGVRVARSAGGAVITGTLAGGACALAAVRFFGPAAEFETAAVRSAIEYALIGAVVAVVVIASSAAARARKFVDASTTTRSWVRFIPWELIPVAAAIVTFTRLDRIGGIQQIGAKVAHADFLAQCFPLMAILAPLAVVARPILALLRRWRLAGRRMPPSVMTGLRRSLAEPTVTAAVLLATALAAGSFTLARLLTDSTEVLLQDKATTFLGSDLSITSRGAIALPPPFDVTGTVVARAQGHSGAQAIDFLGLDRATFVRAVHWRADGSTQSLDELISDLAPRTNEPLPAVVVGNLPDTHLESLIHRPIEVRPVATARWFPGFHNGATLVVVDADALRALIPTAPEIWLRDPPPDAVARLSAAGLVVRTPRDLTQVFDVTSFLTVRWSYATLTMLAALVGIVVLLTQLLVLDARRQSRQAAHVLTTRMGLTGRGEAIGLVAELAPALVGGAGLGVLIGWIVSRASVARLDSLRQLRPPARLVAEPSTAIPLATGVVGCLAALVVVGLVMVKRTRVMGAMRGTA